MSNNERVDIATFDHESGQVPLGNLQYLDFDSQDIVYDDYSL